MMNRRNFLKQGLAAGAAVSISPKINLQKYTDTVSKPVIITTWQGGLKANPVAWSTLQQGGTALDACEQGVRVIEADPTDTSVGIGGLPDREGRVTLDACVMDHQGNCGSVVFLEHILHPVSVARKVMENTPHVYLAGDGALQFALEQGFTKQNLLTPKSEAAYKKWCKEKDYRPSAFAPNHDTVGMLAMDNENNISGACSTSGWAYKIRGRFGDSPVIGAGLYIDNEVGGATATGLGELMIKVCGTHLICEFMRNGLSAYEACKAAVKRVWDKYPQYRNEMVCFIAIAKNGDATGYSLNKGFQYTLTKDGETKVIDADYLNK